MIIAYSAGGDNDILARLLQKPLEKLIGTNLIIENIPAGSTKVGTMELMKAKPDGYTLMFHGDQSWIGTYYSKTYDFKAWKMLTPIANVATDPYSFIEIRADGPFKTWGELVKYAKENPGKCTCAGAISGGMPELVFNEIIKAAGIQCRYVPFAGAAPAKTALLGGHVDFRITQPAGAITGIRAGQTKGIGVSTEKRYDLLPDVPTYKELGIFNESIIMTRSVWGPPKMSPEITDKLAKFIERATKDSEFIKAAQDKWMYKIEFYSASKMVEELDKFEKMWGPQFAAFYK
jgi:tripartite-type tricarboxylate transporter receptor subunit TctC